MKNAAFLAILLLGSSPGFAYSKNEPVVKIDVGRDYDAYSVQDLKRRILQLELAVAQLQSKVFGEEQGKTTEPVKMFTCYLTTFGKTYSETATSQMKAKVDVIKKCTDAHHAVHCAESEIKCGQ